MIYFSAFSNPLEVVNAISVTFIIGKEVGKVRGIIIANDCHSEIKNPL